MTLVCTHSCHFVRVFLGPAQELLLLFAPHWQRLQHGWDPILPTAVEVQQADATQRSLYGLTGG